MSFISGKLDISLNLHKTLCEIEGLDKKWVIDDVPVEEHSYGRIPGEEEIRFWSIPRGSMKLITMFALVRRAANLLDLGGSVGYSALWLSVVAKLNNGIVHTVEIFEPKIALARKYFQQSGMSQYINLITDDIASVLKQWPGSAGKFDFVLFDADKQNHFEYLRLLEPNIAENAVLVVDNASNFRHLQARLFEYLDSSEKYLNLWHDYENGLELFVNIE